MRGLTAAWLTGLAIVTWRQVHQGHHLPVPAVLAGVSGLFAGLALLADAAPSAARVITLTAWGLDIAGLLNVLPAGLFSEIQTAATASTAGAAENEGTLGPAKPPAVGMA